MLTAELVPLVGRILRLPGIELAGIGTNLACASGVVPDTTNMAVLSALATSIERTFGLELPVVSGGNSANLDWALGEGTIGRVDDLRLGEAILLGREPLHRRAITGLHTDAFTVVAEVIESRTKPSVPWGRIARTAFGEAGAAVDRGHHARTIVSLGRQDVDPDGLDPPAGSVIVAASSDHLVLTGATTFPIGAEVRLQPDYSALLRAATSPFVERVFTAVPAPG